VEGIHSTVVDFVVKDKGISEIFSDAEMISIVRRSDYEVSEFDAKIVNFSGDGIDFVSHRLEDLWTRSDLVLI
jgi:limonene-1,2-epoxide hydrolase